jgi:hypothetical protein
MLINVLHVTKIYTFYLLYYISTTQGHLQVTFFFKESIALHTMSLVLLSKSLFINLLLYGVPSSYFCIAAALCNV